jgi:hypothetical protein
MPMGSWRALFLVALSLAVIGCSRKGGAPPEDPAFESRWQALAATEEAVVVGDDPGAGLGANVRKAARPKVEPEPPRPAAGGLPEAPPGHDVQRVIRSHMAAVKGCYLSAARQGSGRSGKAIVSFAIGSDGRPTNVQVDAPSFKGTPLPTCLSSQVSFWSFPRSKKGAAEVSYPFVFVGG